MLGWNRTTVMALLIVLSSANGLFAQGMFAPQVSYPAGDAPRSVFSIDFDGDGNNDLATANGGSDNVSILLGNGDGTFQSAVNYAAGSNPYSVFAADFNGDGNNDLVTANGGSDNVSTLLGNGDGTFQSAVNYPAGDGPRSVFAIDFNGDSHNDVVTANYSSNNVSILLGNGDGTFQSAVNHAVAVGPRCVLAVDFSGDGYNDLATANYPSDNVSILPGNGDGTFQSAVGYYVGADPSCVFSTDFNSDGYNDLAIAKEEYSMNVSILLGNGDGTFQSVVRYDAGDGPRSVFSTDFNADGYNDLVTANTVSDDVSILLGKGDGTFRSAVDYAAGDYPCAVFSIDLNGDGDNDLIAANYGSDNVSILLHTNTYPNLEPQVTSPAYPVFSHCDDPIEIQFTAFDPEDDPIIEWQLHSGYENLGDIDNDGRFVWTYYAPQEGFAALEVRCRDDAYPDHWSDWFTCDIEFINQAPQFAICPSGINQATVGSELCLEFATEDEPCDYLVASVFDRDGAFGTLEATPYPPHEVCFTPAFQDEGKFYHVGLLVEDGVLADTCYVDYKACGMVAGFFTEMHAALANEPLQFSDSSLGSPETWYWRFGDGGTSTEQNPTYIYTDTGVYDVFLRAGDAFCEDSTHRPIYVYDSLFADLKLYWSSTPVRPGFDYRLSIKYRNEGTDSAYNTVLRVRYPDQVEFIEFDTVQITAGSYDGYTHYGDSNLIRVSLGSVEPTGVLGGEFLFKGKVDSSASPGDEVTGGVGIENGREYPIQDVVIGSMDPNDKLASPGGLDLWGPVEPLERIHYTVQFENKAEATADAIYVMIVDTLDADLDWSTLAFGLVSHPDALVTQGFDPFTGIITWFFENIMLPPNHEPPEGEGYVSYSVCPKAGLPYGTDIANSAYIKFDYNAWLHAPDEGMPIVRTITAATCCLPPTVGDVDQSGGVDITDISVLIDNQFLTLTPLLCEDEGDVDFSGAVDITDVSVLIDNQFLTLTPLPPCP